MFKCDICGRDDFKSKAGVTRHSKSCVAVDEKEPAAVVADVPKNDVRDIDIKIKKLKDAISSSLDAEHKYGLECELKRLTEG